MYCTCTSQTEFIHGQGKVRENHILKSGNFVSDQGISKSLFKVSEKLGNFTFRLAQNVIGIFSCRQGNFVLKIIYKPSLFWVITPEIIILHGQ